MILRRKAVAPTHEWEAVVEDSAPELDEVDEVTTPAVGAEEDVVEDSAPELDEADAIGGLVVLDTPPIFWLSAKFFKCRWLQIPPLVESPFSKSDDEANERARVQIHEHLFANSNTGVISGSIKDNS